MVQKKLIAILLVAVVLLLLLVVWVAARFLNNSSDPAGPSPYSAVYLSTGDIYYGKLSWFPIPKMTDVWYLQRGYDAQSEQQQLGLAPLSSVFWKPVDEITLNPKQIVFWTKLRNDSEVAQAIANPNLLRQGGQQGQQSAATSTFQGPSGPPPSSQ